MLKPEVMRAVWELQQVLGLSHVICGSLTLNFNNGELASYDVNHHLRAPQDLTPRKVVDRAQECA